MLSLRNPPSSLRQHFTCYASQRLGRPVHHLSLGDASWPKNQAFAPAYSSPRKNPSQRHRGNCQPTAIDTYSLEASRWESASPLVPGGTAFGPNAQVSSLRAASLARQVEPLRLAAASWLLWQRRPRGDVLQPEFLQDRLPARSFQPEKGKNTGPSTDYLD
jgi:hypothetical protein